MSEKFSKRYDLVQVKGKTLTFIIYPQFFDVYKTGDLGRMVLLVHEEVGRDIRDIVHQRMNILFDKSIPTTRIGRTIHIGEDRSRSIISFYNIKFKEGIKIDMENGMLTPQAIKLKFILWQDAKTNEVQYAVTDSEPIYSADELQQFLQNVKEDMLEQLKLPLPLPSEQGPPHPIAEEKSVFSNTKVDIKKLLA